MKKGIMLLMLLSLLSILLSCTIQTQKTLASASQLPSSSPTASAIPDNPAPSSLESNTEKTVRYYVFNNGGRAGVVDSKGNIVLPPKFADVQILRQDNSPTLFFTDDGMTHIKGEETKSNGGLYYTDGKRVNETSYENAEPISGDLIDVSDKDDNHGIISFSGKEVIPCKYGKVNLCDGCLLAYEKIKFIKNDNPKRKPVIQAIDVYDLSGKFLRSGNITAPDPYYYYNNDSNYEFDENFYDNTDDKYIKFCNEAGTDCGLMDIQFNIVVSPVWEKIEPCENGGYIVKKSGLYGVIDSSGKEIIPLKFTDLEVNYTDNAQNKIAFTASSSDGYYSFEKTGKLLYYSDKYIYIEEINGVSIAKDTSGMEFAFDSEGEYVFPPSNEISWDSDHQLFNRYRNMNTGNHYTYIYYTKDRVELPVSKFDFCKAVSSDRFIVSIQQSDKAYFGISDITGKLIVPAIYAGIEQENKNENYLIFSLDDEYGVTHSGVMDLNGNIILPAVFDFINENSHEVYYAETGTICGLIDINGNWLYRTSKFDTIQD